MHPSIPHNTLAGAVISFGKLLKEHGFTVSIPKVMDALTSVSYVGVAHIEDFRTALHACFVTRAEEKFLFERLFVEFWVDRFKELTESDLRMPCEELESSATDAIGTEDIMLLEPGDDDGQGQAPEQDQPSVAYSPQEILRERDFRELPETLDARVDHLIKEIVAPLIRRLGARRRAAPQGTQLDFRRLFRRNMLYGGEIYNLPRIRQRLRIKRLVFVCDVSGSMNPYLRFMLRFIKEIQDLPTQVETFVFATRLTRITPMLVRLPFARAMEEIGKAVQDWQGGTRIGSCLQQLTSFRGGAILRSSTVVLIFSDGWDRGDPSVLEREMIKLHLRCYRVIWINPLLGGVAYEPTCRGMKTALPHVDSFLPGHNIASIERLAGTLRGILS
jgi:uncharacterized protein with von Willebrand factor type A (vWA) domain